MSAITDIEGVRRRWAEAINAGSARAFVKCVTDDAVWLPPRGKAVQGAVALCEWLEGLFREFRYEFDTKDERVRLVGDSWAVEDARFSSVLRPESEEGETLIHHGAYTVLWRRLDSGEWRIERYIDRTESPHIA